MSDNELYTYFKDRSTSFDELPGDTLWEKIEAGLNSKANTKEKPLSLFIKIGLAVLITTITAVITLNRFSKQETTTPINTKTEIPALIPSAKATEADEIIPTTVNDTVKKKKKGTIGSISKKQDTKDTPTSNQPAYVKFRTINKNTDSDTIALKSSLPDAKTKIMPGRIVVTAGRVGKQDFELLIKHSLETHKDAHGSLIIVKAPGQQTFRHKIPALPKPEPIAFKILSQKGDSTKPSPQYVKFLTTKDSIIPEHIKFKPTQDTVKPHN